MGLFIYNTLSRQKEEFIPLMQSNPKTFNQVGIYSCGPTVYASPHIGNLRAYCFADLLRNTIKHIVGLPVKHIVNITDVGHLTSDGDQGEDKLEKGSKREGKTVWEIAQYYEKLFYEDLGKLNIDPFDAYPKATNYIIEQINIVKDLIFKDLTYIIKGDGIYMDTSNVKDYGKLLPAGHLEGIKAGARIDTEGKKNPTDFALWKFSPVNENRQMEWIFDGPRSGILITDDMKKDLSNDENTTRGFPGRHIECSAMSHATLGNHFDIHTGGIDHIPVHHTNEIAQSESCFVDHKPRVPYRMHCQFLNINGEKISKSLGNTITIQDLEEKGFDALDFRMLCLTAHYRSFLDFTREQLTAAKNTRKNLKKKVSHLLGSEKKVLHEEISLATLLTNISPAKISRVNEMIATILDDLNTPEFLSKFQKFLGEETTQEDIQIILFFEKNILKLGLCEDEITFSIPEKIVALAQQRLEAKREKNFSLADELRKKILEMGYEVIDTKDGFEIKIYNS